MKIRNFSKFYKNKEVNIKDISLNKRITFLLGVNGSGKSTLLKAIAKLISYNGKITSELSVCYLPENPSYPSSITVYEFLKNLSLIDQSTDIVIDQDLNIFNLKQKKNTQIKNLSKGMLQKLNLIQCLFQHKELYLLDEPYSGLDKTAIKLLNNYIKTSSSNYLISTHLFDSTSFLVADVITIE